MIISKDKEYRKPKSKPVEYTKYNISLFGFNFELLHDSKKTLQGFKNIIFFWFIMFLLIILLVCCYKAYSLAFLIMGYAK